MTNVIIVYDTLEPAALEYIKLFNILSSNQLLNYLHHPAKEVSYSDICWCDILLFIRSTSQLELDLARIGKRQGKLVLLFLDDDFLSLNDNYGECGYSSLKHTRLLKILGKCDCLLSTNPHLIKKYISISNVKHSVLTDTIVSQDEFHSPNEKHHNAPLRIALYVNDGASRMFDEIIRPVMPLLCERYPNKLSFYFFALHPDLDDYKDKVEIHYVPHMQYAKFKEYLGTHGFDIGIAPLLDEGFSKYKYFNKYIEYTLAGIPAVYSDCELYRMAVTNGENGLLTSNDTSSWFEAIGKLIDDGELRFNLISNAQRHLLLRNNQKAIIDRLLKGFPQLIHFKARQQTSKYVKALLQICRWKHMLFHICIWMHSLRVLIERKQFSLIFKRIKNKVCA